MKPAGRRICLLKNLKKRKRNNGPRFSSPIYTAENIGTARIKVVRVPRKIVLISHLHALSSTVLNDVKLCFGTGKRLNISASVLDSCLVRMPMVHSKMEQGTVY